jgi:predicted permease
MGARRFVRRLMNALRPARAERELAREIGSHLTLLEDEYRRRGLSPEDARRAARRAFGGVEQTKEHQRDARSFRWMDDARHDLPYAARLLRRSPVSALTAALSLAIGLGANITIFTIANALLFRAPAGVSDPERLIDIFRAEEGSPRATFTTSYPYARDVGERATTLAGVYAFEYELQPVALGTRDAVEPAFAQLVTTNYFATLGVLPAAGRLLTSADSDEPGVSPVVVLSHRFWQRRYNGDASVIGRTIDINRHPFTIVGIAREGFRGTNVVAADLWMPMGMVLAVDPASTRLTDRRPADVGMGGRLKPGVPIDRAAAELDAIARQLEREYPVADRGTRLRVARLSSIPGPIASIAAGFFSLLLALVSVVLIIACANVAGVLLARGAARRREIAVRLAMGAGRARVIRQLLLETILLFAAGGAAGLLLARGMTSLLLSALPASPIPLEVSLPLDGRVIVYAMGLSLIAALLSGLAPALSVSKTDVVGGLRDDVQGPSDKLRARSAFVIAQVACSIILVVIAGLLAKALDRVSSFDQGFDPHGVEIASLDLSRAGYTAAAGRRFTQNLLDHLRGAPGVQAATAAEYMPGRGGLDVKMTVAGASPPDGQLFFTGTWSAVDPDYFATLRIALVAGRSFTAADRDAAQPVIVISETAARAFWPAQDAVGRTIFRHLASRTGEDVVTALRVVGVARDVRQPLTRPGGGPDARVRQDRGAQGVVTVAVPSGPMLMMYVPLAQQYTPRFTILARGAAERTGTAIRDLVRSLDPNLPMVMPQPLDTAGGPVYLQLRIAASVAGSIGLAGLFLAAIGIYGVTAYTTARRTREIGIRLAIGAQRGDVLALVIRQGLSLVAIGSIAGVLLAAAGSRLFASMLFGVSPLDPIAFTAAVLLFAAIGLAASYVPARRATRVDPIAALRCE